MTQFDPSTFDPATMEWPSQPLCPCCKPSLDVPNGCAFVVESERTGQCEMHYGEIRPSVDEMPRCQCYGSLEDGGLCEDCYLSTK